MEENKECLDCFYIKHGIHFFYDDIRACCTNVKGPIFYKDYRGEIPVDWNYVYETRKKYVKAIEEQRLIPEECKDCFEIPNFLKNSIDTEFPNKIEKVYFQNFMSCNVRCIYCSYENIERGYRYNLLPIVKSMIDNNILSKSALVYISGGEPTIMPEFDELLSILTSYLNSQIEIFTSGYKYSKSIEQGFVDRKCRLLLSIDCGCRETYLKIKQVDAFDRIIENIRNYITVTPKTRDLITLKYIIQDGINDNKEEVDKFFEIVKELDIKNVRIDVDLKKYKSDKKLKVPDLYFDLIPYFNKKAEESCRNIYTYGQVETILMNGKK